MQCFTSGTWINYRWAANGDLVECMEVQKSFELNIFFVLRNCWIFFANIFMARRNAMDSQSLYTKGS